MKRCTVVIPAFKAEKHICDCLASIQMQTVRDDISVIISSDDGGKHSHYDFVKDRYPDLDITTLYFEDNVGPGLARQRGLDACKTDWVTFIDADDIFFTPLAIETLLKGIKDPQNPNLNVIEVQGPFLQEIQDIDNPQVPRVMPRNDVGHPWVFGRLYNVKFLKQNEIKLTKLRAMEDGEFNWKIRMTIEGSPFIINIIQDPVYLWRTGSEHSITRIGSDSEDGIPQYNFDLCQIGATIASINAAKFCKKKNPFNGGIDRFVTEMMVGQYFTYVECLERKPIFAEQNFFNAKRFYHECFKEIENRIDNKILSDIYTFQRGAHAQDLLGIIPEISFFEFMDRVKTEEYRGEEELKDIRSKLPQEVIDNDLKTGVATF